jgi:hypothetical protein
MKFLHEGVIFLHRIKADSQNLHVLFFKFSDSVSEPGSFRGSPGRIGLGIKPQDYVLATKIG